MNILHTGDKSPVQRGFSKIAWAIHSLNPFIYKVAGSTFPKLMEIKGGGGLKIFARKGGGGGGKAKWGKGAG